MPDRPCADAIFYVLRTGCQWQALDQTELVPHSTAHDRYQAWLQADVFLKLWQAGVERFDELQGIDWSFSSMDGAMTKAPLGGEKTGPNPTDRGKAGVKRSLLTEGHGVPIAVTVAGANRTDMKLVRATLENIVVARPDPRLRNRKACVWTKAMITRKYAIPWPSLALRRISGRVAKKPKPSNAKRASAHGAGWSNAHTAG